MTVALVVAIVNVAVAVAGAINGADKDAAIDSINETSSANTARVKNAARRAANVATEAQNNLKRFVQATNNSRALDAMGGTIGTTLTNYQRQRDQMLKGGFEQSIQAAEEAGAQASSSAFAGIGGSVSDNISSATILRNDRIAQGVREQGAALEQNYRSQQAATVKGAIDGLDNRTVLDSLDNNIDVGLKYASPTWFGKFLAQGGAQATSQAFGSFATSGYSSGQGNVGSTNTGSAANSTNYYGGNAQAYP